MLKQCLPYPPTGTNHSDVPNDLPIPHAKREKLLSFIDLKYIDQKRYFIEEGDPLPKVEAGANH